MAKKVHLSQVSPRRAGNPDWFNGKEKKSHRPQHIGQHGLKRAGHPEFANYTVKTDGGHGTRGKFQHPGDIGLDCGGDEAVFTLPHPGSVQPSTVERAPIALPQDADGE